MDRAAQGGLLRLHNLDTQVERPWTWTLVTLGASDLDFDHSWGGGWTLVTTPLGEPSFPATIRVIGSLIPSETFVWRSWLFFDSARMSCSLRWISPNRQET